MKYLLRRTLQRTEQYATIEGGQLQYSHNRLLKPAVLHTKTGAFKHASCNAILVQSFKMQKKPADMNGHLQTIEAGDVNKILPGVKNYLLHFILLIRQKAYNIFRTIT